MAPPPNDRSMLFIVSGFPINGAGGPFDAVWNSEGIAQIGA